MRLTLLVMIAALISGVAYAQGFAPNIVGNWQGTLPQGKGLRLVLQLAKVDTGDGQAMLYSIDQSEQGIPVSSFGSSSVIDRVLHVRYPRAVQTKTEPTT